MEYEDDVFFQPTTFKEKVKDKIPDVLYFGLIIFAFSFAAFGNKNNQADANTATQSVKQIQEVKQTPYFLMIQ